MLRMIPGFPDFLYAAPALRTPIQFVDLWTFWLLGPTKNAWGRRSTHGLPGTRLLLGLRDLVTGRGHLLLWEEGRLWLGEAGSAPGLVSSPGRWVGESANLSRVEALVGPPPLESRASARAITMC